MFAFDDHLAIEDGLDTISRVDIAMLGVLIVVSLVFINLWRFRSHGFAIAIVGLLARVNIFENTTFFHGVLGLGEELTRPLQS